MKGSGELSLPFKATQTLCEGVFPSIVRVDSETLRGTVTVKVGFQSPPDTHIYPFVITQRG